MNKAIEVEYTVREDIDEKNCVEHSIDATELDIPDGWVVIYIEEVPLGEISAHDSAAMSPTTKLVIKSDAMDTYDYSADRYIVATITEEDTVMQSMKVNRG